MGNSFMLHSRHVLGLAVVICTLSFTLAVVNGQPLGNSDGQQGEMVKKATRLKKNHARFRAALAATKKHARRLLSHSGVVATGTAIGPDGEPMVKIFTARAGVTGIPDRLDGLRVKTYMSGRIYAQRGATCEASGDNACQTSERWPLPVPLGVSVGHSGITAGTIGARLTDGTNVFILSNNHVLANVNQASIGDSILQPGAFDGGLADDAIATLSDFEPLRFCTVFFIWLICDQTNVIDAAVAISTTADLDVSTPQGEYDSTPGYGSPSSVIHSAYGDPDVIGDEQLAQLLGLGVQKYGRTTGTTTGTIDAVNATVDVCYDSSCSLVARFVDQLIILPGTFSSGGDSGSLIVTNDGVSTPVGLLFAGSNTNTIANRIDLVLDRFGLSIDDGSGNTSVIDVAVTDISIAANPVIGGSTDVAVTVKNVGNQDVMADFEVILSDEMEAQEVGRTTVQGLAAGASTTHTFPWTPTVNGMHTLQASHTLSDANANNDASTTGVNVLAQPSAGLALQLWQGWVSTDAWTPVPLAQAYGNDMVVVCTPNYDLSDTGPTVVRVRNAMDKSFEVGLARPWFGALPGEHWSAYVHCMVVRAGVYTEAEDGVKLEAVRLENVSSTDNSGSWVGEQQNYSNAYTNPVVVGQVIGASGTIPGAIGDWSVFWSRGTGRNRPPSANALYVGRHTGEDPNPRPQETIGFVVIEAGNGVIDGVQYTAGLGADTIRGVGDNPPYNYAFNGLSSASIAILSQAGMDGRNGGWPVLYGSTPLTDAQVSIAIEEDWYRDSERRHTTEQVGYIVFE